MCDKASTVNTQETSPRRQKTLCTRCARSFPCDQFDFHYDLCGQEDEYMVYHHEDHQESNMLDIDLVDIPLSGSYVQMKGLMAENDKDLVKLPLVPYLPDQNNEECHEKCCFCQNEIKVGERTSLLPCGHRLEGRCLKKWNIIVEPCRVCMREIRH